MKIKLPHAIFGLRVETWLAFYLLCIEAFAALVDSLSSKFGLGDEKGSVLMTSINMV